MNGLAALAALAAALAVIAGAYGAHGAPEQLAHLYRTGAEYQLVHAVAALVLLGRAGGRGPATLLLAGGLLFGGSLYALALGAPKLVGPITPLGGLLLIAGWLWGAWILWRR